MNPQQPPIQGLNKIYPPSASLKRIIRYLISGGTGAATNLGIFALLIHYTTLWYVFASISSFCISVVVSFILQKYWTFQNRSQGKTHSQALIFISVSLINLGINTLIVFILVDGFHSPKFLAQFVAAGLVAFASYGVYKKFVFTEKKIDPAI